MKPIIRVENLSKQYRLGGPQVVYSTVRESLVGAIRAPLKRLRRNRGSAETIWAVKDLSFEIMPGEVVGIIGRNGAGKSTILKVLSRITEPTTGRAELYGRVASMLEVGTGFHPELTGRENIFLNGAILGMRRAEIKRRFDEIVAFDEVLAVGDAEFQKKCLGKMSEVARGGRTVLFVSHNMGAIRRLTRRCILLDHGRVKLDAPVQQAIDLYLAQAADGLAGGIFVRDEPRPADRPFY